MASQVPARVGTVRTQPIAGDKRVPGHTIEQWAVDLIGAINQYGYKIPVNATTVGVLLRWASVESGGYNPNASGGRYNPLNTTETSQGGKAGQGGSQGNIADFASYEDGIRNQAYNLARAGGGTGADRFGYRRILSALEQGNVAGVFAAIDASSFGTHFGSGGTPLPVAQLPGGAFIDIGGGSSGDSGGGTPASTIGVELPGWAKGIVNSVPGLGGALNTLTLPAQLAGILIGVYANWRYTLEVVIGGVLIIFGALLIAHDTGALGAAKQRAEQGAAVAAVAA